MSNKKRPAPRGRTFLIGGISLVEAVESLDRITRSNQAIESGDARRFRGAKAKSRDDFSEGVVAAFWFVDRK